MRSVLLVLVAGTLAIAPVSARAGLVPDSTAAPVAPDTTMAPMSAPSPTRMTPADEVNLPPLLPAPNAALGEALRKGGYILVFRHAITDWSQRDSDGENYENRKAQRNLSDAGRTQSTEIGKAIAAAGIPIGEVQASPMWRCRDTAELAFGRHTANPDLVRRGTKPREARVRMLGTVPKKGTNTVLVTHQDQLMPIVTGLRREQLREGEALIVKPLGEGKYEVLAQVGLEQWRALASHKP